MYVPILGENSPVIRWTFRKIDDGSFDGKGSQQGCSTGMNVPWLFRQTFGKSADSFHKGQIFLFGSKVGSSVSIRRGRGTV
jgi:hypothetical protein